MATQFYDHSCSVVSNLAEGIVCVKGKQLKDFYKQKVSDSIYLEPPTTNEILDQIITLKNKAVGHDNIQRFFLKLARFVVALYLKYFLTMCSLKVSFLTIAK